jgi:hypothetical protein
MTLSMKKLFFAAYVLAVVYRGGCQSITRSASATEVI